MLIQREGAKERGVRMNEKQGLARKARDESGLNLGEWFAPRLCVDSRRRPRRLITIPHTGRLHLRQR